jgi:hypothetical protein
LCPLESKACNRPATGVDEDGREYGAMRCTEIGTAWIDHGPAFIASQWRCEPAARLPRAPSRSRSERSWSRAAHRCMGPALKLALRRWDLVRNDLVARPVLRRPLASKADTALELRTDQADAKFQSHFFNRTIMQY